LPLPILLKIKKGILFVPSSYSISKGLSLAMRNAMKYLEHIGRPHLSKAIFDNTNMNDHVFSNVLSGLRTRSEFMSLNSVNNVIGQESCIQLCALMNNERSDHLLSTQRTPIFRELTLVSNKM